MGWGCPETWFPSPGGCAEAFTKSFILTSPPHQSATNEARYIRRPPTYRSTASEGVSYRESKVSVGLVRVSVRRTEHCVGVFSPSWHCECQRRLRFGGGLVERAE